MSLSEAARWTSGAVTKEECIDRAKYDIRARIQRNNDSPTVNVNGEMVTFLTVSGELDRLKRIQKNEVDIRNDLDDIFNGTINRYEKKYPKLSFDEYVDLLEQELKIEREKEHLKETLMARKLAFSRNLDDSVMCD